MFEMAVIVFVFERAVRFLGFGMRNLDSEPSEDSSFRFLKPSKLSEDTQNHSRCVRPFGDLLLNFKRYPRKRVFARERSVRSQRISRENASDAASRRADRRRDGRADESSRNTVSFFNAALIPVKAQHKLSVLILGFTPPLDLFC